MLQELVLDKLNNIFTNNKDELFDIKFLNIEEQGVVVEVNNSIIIAKGFSKVFLDECVIISNIYYGIISSIRNDIVKIVLLDKTDNIKVGDKVKRTFAPLNVGVSDELIGRILDGLGRPIDGKESFYTESTVPIEQPAVNIIDRQSVNEPMQTGIKAIDSLVPIGRGQRELILGDRQTGKTTIAIDSILNQKNNDVICIYCSIGQRDSSMANVLKILQDNNAMKYTIVIQASGNEIAGQQFLAPYTATSIAEYFMKKGKHVFVVYDDLTKQARAYREISLLLGKNPGREAYPADIFYIHSRLLERSTRMKDSLGGGSITSLPIIETEAGNISAYIPTNVISITDGQIYLSPSLFQKGILPAIDIGQSVSRVGSSAQLPAYKQAVGTLGIEYSQFEELESFSKFTTNLDEETEKIINKGQRIREFLKQKPNNTFNATEQIILLLCLNNNIFKDININKIEEVENLIVKILNERFTNIYKIVNSNQKISQDIINNFLNTIREKLNE